MKLRGHALALRFARIADERDGVAVKHLCRLCSGVVVEHEVDDGTAGCLASSQTHASATGAAVCTAKAASSWEVATDMRSPSNSFSHMEVRIAYHPGQTHTYSLLRRTGAFYCGLIHPFLM